MGGNAAGVVHIWDLKSKTLKKTYQVCYCFIFELLSENESATYYGTH